MKLAEKILREVSVLDEPMDDLYKRVYTDKINRMRDGLLEKASKVDGYRFELGKDVGRTGWGPRNKCETNTFNFVKQQLQHGVMNFMPVGGFAFEGENLFPVEHWWVYDSETNKFMDVTQLEGPAFRCYAGIINRDIQEEIIRAEYFYDINFFKGGNVGNKYFF